MPAPRTATSGASAVATDGVAAAISAAWIPAASGSMSTARSSGTSSPIGWSWLSWATNSGDHPPPVEQQNPVWIPGSSVPVARWA